MGENVQIKEGRDTSEFRVCRLIMLVGAALMLVPLAMLAFGKVNTGDPGWGEYLEFLKWVAGIGAALCGSVGAWYTAKRTDLKKAITSGLAALCVLGLLAAPAMAGTVTGDEPQPQPVTSTPEPAPAEDGNAASDTAKTAWNAIKKAMNLSQDGEPLTAAQTAALMEALGKLSQQNAQLKAEADAARARSQVFKLSGGASQADALVAALTDRVNQQAVLSGMARNAYGAPGMAGYGAAAGGAAAMTPEQIRKAVKDELEANKTWWDKAPWYVRIPLSLGTLLILKDMGISLPGIN